MKLFCYTTKVRQEEAYNLAKQCDLMLVIGDRTSSNTNELYRICKSECHITYLISDKNELSSIKKYK